MRYSKFKHKMKRLQISQNLVYEKFYVHEIATVDLSKIYFLKNAKKTCKPNNRDLNRNWIKVIFKTCSSSFILLIITFRFIITFTRTNKIKTFTTITSTYLTNSYDAISSLFLLISLESLKFILILSVGITETSKLFHEDSYVIL